jgi:hypothetical protein
MDMFVLYPVVAVAALLIWFFTVRIVYFQRESRLKKQKQQGKLPGAYLLGE